MHLYKFSNQDNIQALPFINSSAETGTHENPRTKQKMHLIYDEMQASHLSFAKTIFNAYYTSSMESTRMADIRKVGPDHFGAILTPKNAFLTI